MQLFETYKGNAFLKNLLISFPHYKESFLITSRSLVYPITIIVSTFIKKNSFRNLNTYKSCDSKVINGLLLVMPIHVLVTLKIFLQNDVGLLFKDSMFH